VSLIGGRYSSVSGKGCQHCEQMLTEPVCLLDCLIDREHSPMQTIMYGVQLLLQRQGIVK
jgi:hypothetical protein